MLWPLLTGPLFLSTLAANATANLMRNLWAFSIIFCGHFPEGTHEFTIEETEGESKGHWYFRQLLGSANIRGAQAVPRAVRATSATRSSTTSSPTCRRTATRRSRPRCRRSASATACRTTRAGFTGQLGSTWRKIWRLALP